MNSICRVVIVVACISSQCSSSSENLAAVAAVSEKDCEKPPKTSKYKLLQCCSIPNLFKSEIKEKCIAECSSNLTTTSKTNPWCCMTNCTMEESSIGVNGQIDKIQARKVFKSIFDASSTDAMKHGDDIIDKCESEPPQNDQQKEECEHPEYAQLLTCIHREFFRNCLQPNTEASCMKIKDFVKKCPTQRDLLFES